METNPLIRMAHPIHGPSHLIDLIEARYGTDEANQATEAIKKVQAAAIPWLKLLLALLPLLIPIIPPPFSTILAAILALLGGG